MNSSKCGTCWRASEISHSGEQKIETITKTTKGSVTASTQKSAHLPRKVVMVRIGFDEFVSTDRTLAFLKVEQLLPV